MRNLLEPERIPLSAKVARNVIYNSARSIILAPLPFLTIPFFLRKLGAGGYGTWAVFLAVNAMTSLADLGLVTSVSKHVAQYYANRDYRALGQLVSTGLALYLAIATAVGAVLWAGSQFFVFAFFRNSPTPLLQLFSLWRVLVLLVMANVLVLFFSSIVAGLQRMDLTTAMSSLNTLTSALLSVALLYGGLGLKGMLWGYVVSAWIVAVLYSYLVWRLLPEARWRLRSCSTAVAREILSFSAKAYVTQVAVAIHNQIEKFYLAHFVGVIPVGWFDISSDLALKFRTIPSLFLNPVMPAASELDARKGEKQLLNLYFRVHKYIALVGVPLGVFVVLLSKSFVSLWVGSSFSMIAGSLSALLATNLFNLTTGPGFLILMGRGKLGPGVYSALLGIFLNVSLSFVLIRLYGFQGAVIGTSFSLFLASVYFHIKFQHETGTSLLQIAKSAYAKPTLAAMLSGSILFAFFRGPNASWVGLITGAFVFGATYFLLLLLLKFFDNFDLSLVNTVVHVPAFIRRIVPNAELGGPLFPDHKNAEAASDWD